MCWRRAVHDWHLLWRFLRRPMSSSASLSVKMIIVDKIIACWTGTFIQTCNNLFLSFNASLHVNKIDKVIDFQETVYVSRVHQYLACFFFSVGNLFFLSKWFQPGIFSDFWIRKPLPQFLQVIFPKVRADIFTNVINVIITWLVLQFPLLWDIKLSIVSLHAFITSSSIFITIFKQIPFCDVDDMNFKLIFVFFMWICPWHLKT